MFQPQQCKTRDQLQEEYWKKLTNKHVENKQHATKQPMVNEKIKEELKKKIFRQVKLEIKLSKIYRMQQK